MLSGFFIAIAFQRECHEQKMVEYQRPQKDYRHDSQLQIIENKA